MAHNIEIKARIAYPAAVRDRAAALADEGPIEPPGDQGVTTRRSRILCQ